MGLKYWHVCENVISEMLKTGNVHTVKGYELITDEDYDEQTRWSDFNVAIPILFNLYHGIELNLKGLIAASGGEVTRSHKLSELKAQLQERCDSKALISFFDGHVDLEKVPDILQEFFTENKITPDEYYLALRYPYVLV